MSPCSCGMEGLEKQKKKWAYSVSRPSKDGDDDHSVEEGLASDDVPSTTLSQSVDPESFREVRVCTWA